MAYVSEDVYSCNLCGVGLPWEGGDDDNGVMWNCSICGIDFCTKCFVQRYGAVQYLRMQHKSELVCCPDCWEKHQHEVDEADEDDEPNLW